MAELNSSRQHRDFLLQLVQMRLRVALQRQTGYRSVVSELRASAEPQPDRIIMDFHLRKNNQIAPAILRRFGYAPYINKDGEHSYVRRLHGTDFPRFHLYVGEEDRSRLRCSLHLDQKQPSYMGARAHGGDYDSEVVRAEIERMGGEIMD